MNIIKKIYHKSTESITLERTVYKVYKQKHGDFHVAKIKLIPSTS